MKIQNKRISLINLLIVIASLLILILKIKQSPDRIQLNNIHFLSKAVIIILLGFILPLCNNYFAEKMKTNRLCYQLSLFVFLILQFADLQKWPQKITDSIFIGMAMIIIGLLFIKRDSQKINNMRLFKNGKTYKIGVYGSITVGILLLLQGFIFSKKYLLIGFTFCFFWILFMFIYSYFSNKNST
jgi:hypothetical protein